MFTFDPKFFDKNSKDGESSIHVTKMVVNISMFTESGEIGNMTMKVSALVEKEPVTSM